MGAAGRCLSLQRDGHLTGTSRVPDQVRLTGVKHSRPADAVSHPRRRSSLPLSKGWSSSVLFCDGCLPSRHRCPSPSSSVGPPPPPPSLPATRMCGRRQARPRQPLSPIPVRPQGGSPPYLRPRTSLSQGPVPSTTYTATKPPSIARAGPSRSGTTVAAVAAIGCVADPELPMVVPAPALDAAVVLRSTASLMHPEDRAGCLQGGLPKAPHRCPDLPAAVLAMCLARATAAAHTSSAAPPLWPLHRWATLHDSPGHSRPLILRLPHMGAAGRCLRLQ